MVYHVTPRSNLKRIFAQGLVPKTGVRSRIMKERRRAVYFFPDQQACKEALANWLGWAFAEATSLAILEVELPKNVPRLPKGGYEVAVTDTVPVSAIHRVYNEDFTPLAVKGLGVPAEYSKAA